MRLREFNKQLQSNRLYYIAIQTNYNFYSRTGIIFQGKLAVMQIHHVQRGICFAISERPGKKVDIFNWLVLTEIY